jgi:hypothetical protein
MYRKITAVCCENHTKHIHALCGQNVKCLNVKRGVGVDWRIIIKWIFKKWDGGAWTGLIWLRIGTVGGLL